jgi:hypothetical protein
MFKLPPDDRISSWVSLRTQLETSDNPFQTVVDFWRDAPYVPYNRSVDQYNQKSWPTPWEMIDDNRYDDFTRALMIGYTIKFTNRFKNSVINIRTLIDTDKKSCYNIVSIDEEWVLNFKDNEPVLLKDIPDSFLVENITVLPDSW